MVMVIFKVEAVAHPSMPQKLQHTHTHFGTKLSLDNDCSPSIFLFKQRRDEGNYLVSLSQV